MATSVKYIIICLLAMPAYGLPERHYQDKHCAGITEHVLPDRTRIDCLTETHAIEYDFGKKWAESIGQALGYAVETGRRPGIVLILKAPKDMKYWDKLNRVIDQQCLKIDTWKIEAWQ